MILYDLISVKSPLEFLTYEGEVNTSLSFVSEANNFLMETKVNEFPQAIPFLDVNVWTRLTNNKLIDVKSPIYFYFTNFEVKASLYFETPFVDEVFALIKDWFIHSNKEKIIKLFGNFFILNREFKGLPTKSNKRDLYKFLKEMEGVRNLEEFVKTFDYKMFW